MEHVLWVDEQPNLRKPTLVLAFEGWNDAGDAASVAANHLVEQFGSRPFALLDAEPFYDFRETRPLVRLDDQLGRVISWPENTFSSTEIRRDPNDRSIEEREADVAPGEYTNADLIVFQGIEPQLRWRTFAEQVTDIAEALDVGLVISLGALIADVAHSRPVTIYGTSDDTELCDNLGLHASTYEGPTGIVGVVQDACRTAGLASLSLWATVPSYVPHAASPKAALALVDRLAQVLDVPILAGDLITEAADYEQQVNELVADDEETSAYVRTLEEQHDAAIQPGTGGELIEELEQFLRDQN